MADTTYWVAHHMPSFKPRSIFQLTITGFLTVAGLLIVALVSTARQLDALGEQSQRVVNQSVAAAAAGRVLMEQAFGMERNIRQFQVLQDPQILKVYQDRRAAFDAAARQLSGLNLEPVLNEQALRLLDHEHKIYEVVRAPALLGDATALLPALVGATQSISTEIEAWTRRELQAIREDTQQSRRMLTVQALIFTITALVMAGIFTALITRPLGQVNRAINRLGDGRVGAPVQITGPTDLVQLGERLNWLRERLQLLEKQRSDFLRHVSHELKTPLAAIQESASLLSEGVVGGLNARQQDILRIQHNNCQRLTALISQLLKHHSESFAVLDAPPEALRLDQLAQEVLSNQELALHARGLKVATEMMALTVRGNREQLRVVVDNLVSNAIHHAPKESTVSVWVYQHGEHALCEVADEGAGVPEKDAERIFEAFYRGAPVDDGAYSGSGLGLAIAEEYAKANHGTLSLVKHTGKGALFRLSLPLQETY